MGLFAAYSASQADRYMEAERRNRKLALELEAVGPYLAPLPEDRQQEFRLALGDRTFGREEQGFGRRDKSPATVIDMLMKSKEFREFITEVAKAVRQSFISLSLRTMRTKRTMSKHAGFTLILQSANKANKANKPPPTRTYFA